LHPGVVGTSIAGKNENSFLWKAAWKVFSPFMLSPKNGAKTSIYLASSLESLQSNGLYWDKSKPKEPSALANDAELAKKLWEVSAELIN